MKDLIPHPLVCILGQTLLDDPESNAAIVEYLCDIEDVKNAFDGNEAELGKCIEEVVNEAGSVPVGYQQREYGGGVKPSADAGGQSNRDAIVKKQLPEAAATVLGSSDMPFEFVMLVGYLGPGAVEHTYRLYADPTLEEFTSLRKDDIAFRHRFHTENAPFDEVDVVWVKRTATIGRDRRQPRRADVQALFLEGELMDAAEAGSALPTRIEGSTSDEPFCVSFTCCKRTSVCRPRR